MAEKEYIEREAFLDAIERMKPYHQDADDIAEMLQNFPAADVRPVVRGKWIIETHQIYFEVRCSECGIKSYVHIEDEDTISYANFCPNCGADMREDKANGT